MARAVRGYEAELDAIEIWVNVARRDLNAADRLVDRLTETIERLALHPMMGRSADYLLPGLRLFPVGGYIIYYRPDENGAASSGSFTACGTSRLSCLSDDSALAARILCDDREASHGSTICCIVAWMKAEIRMHNFVALFEDTPARNFETGAPLLLHRGQIGTVVMTYDGTAVEVEFSGPDARAYAILPLPASKLMRLHSSLVSEAA